MIKDVKTYLWGIVLGLVVVVAFATARPVGTATVYEKVAGHVLEFFSPAYVHATPHYYQYAVPVADWEVMFVLGLLLAGVVAGHLSGGKRTSVPEMWASRFGTGTGKRMFVSFVGGVLLLFGARLAGGCTSGHFISGVSQLAISAFVFAGSMFAAGIVTASVLFGRKGRGCCGS